MARPIRDLNRQPSNVSRHLMYIAWTGLIPAGIFFSPTPLAPEEQGDAQQSEETGEEQALNVRHGETEEENQARQLLDWRKDYELDSFSTGGRDRSSTAFQLENAHHGSRRARTPTWSWKTCPDPHDITQIQMQPSPLREPHNSRRTQPRSRLAFPVVRRHRARAESSPTLGRLQRLAQLVRGRQMHHATVWRVPPAGGDDDEAESTPSGE
ncbi:hypothetical protein V8E36_007406 [Tilletia maclaganii]